MHHCLLLLAPALNLPSLTPPSPAELFKAVDAAVYAADRQRDEVLAGVKRSVLGDPLSALQPSGFALPPATSTVAVTGATDGLGREAALFLAQAGFGVVLCARDVAKGEQAAAYIRGSAAEARLAIVPCDLASLASVEDAAPLVVAAASELGSPLRGLMLNAGVWPAQYQTTVDGMELALQANHIGHFRLTQLLLPELQASAEAAGGEARVVTTSSSAHAFASDAGVDDPLWQSKPFDTNANYGRSKLANLQFAQALADRAPRGVRSLAVHPGLVLTTLFKELGPNYQAGSGGSVTGRSAVEDRLAGLPALRELQASTPLKVLVKSPAEGSRPLLYALLAPGLPNGGYIADCEVRDTSPASKDADKREALWEWTSAWVEGQLAARQPPADSGAGEPDCESEEECGVPSD